MAFKKSSVTMNAKGNESHLKILKLILKCEQCSEDSPYLWSLAFMCICVSWNCHVGALVHKLWSSARAVIAAALT